MQVGHTQQRLARDLVEALSLLPPASEFHTAHNLGARVAWIEAAYAFSGRLRVAALKLEICSRNAAFRGAIRATSFRVAGLLRGRRAWPPNTPRSEPSYGFPPTRQTPVQGRTPDQDGIAVSCVGNCERFHLCLHPMRLREHSTSRAAPRLVTAHPVRRPSRPAAPAWRTRRGRHRASGGPHAGSRPTPRRGSGRDRDRALPRSAPSPSPPAQPPRNRHRPAGRRGSAPHAGDSRTEPGTPTTPAHGQGHGDDRGEANALIDRPATTSCRGTAPCTSPAAASPTRSSGACRASPASRRERDPGHLERAVVHVGRPFEVGTVEAHLGDDDNTLLALVALDADGDDIAGADSSTTPIARSMSSGHTLRPPTMITSLIRPHRTSSPSSKYARSPVRSEPSRNSATVASARR